MSKRNDVTGQTIRSVADRLMDVERGEAARRQRSKEQASEKYRQAADAEQRRYRKDPQAFLAERTWTCPHCGRAVEPMVLDNPLVKGQVYVIRREKCGCETEQAQQKAQEKREAAERHSPENLDWRLKLSKAGLVGRLADATFGTYETHTPAQMRQKKRALAYCTALTRGDLGPKKWLVMYGSYGTGKSHLAAAILQNALDRGMTARFRVWPQWLEAIQGSFKGGDTGALVRELQSGDIVAIDDIDKENPSKSGWAEKKLFNALNFRYNLSLPTILTFNHAPGEMVPWLGSAVVDRILGSRYDSIEFKGESHRSGIEFSERTNNANSDAGTTDARG